MLRPRVLVVEDTFLLANEMASELREQGFDVVGVASNVEAAMRHASAADIDTAILGMDLRGRPVDDVIRILVKRQVRLVFVTGHSRTIIPSWIPPSMRFEKPLPASSIVAALKMTLQAEADANAVPAFAVKPPRRAISVGLAVGNGLAREGLRRILIDAGFTIGAEALSFDSFVADQLPPPDVVVIDAADVGPGLANSLAALRDAGQKPALVVLADSLDMEKLRQAVAAGVQGYLMKNVAPAGLKAALERVVAGEMVLPSILVKEDEATAPLPSAGSESLTELSKRELQVLAGLVGGQSNKLIANRLNIAEGTVKAHIKAILKKIGVQNRTQGAIWAMANGISTADIDDGV